MNFSNSIPSEFIVYRFLLFLSVLIFLSYTPDSNLFGAEDGKSYEYHKVVQEIVRIHNEANEKFALQFKKNTESIRYEFDPNTYFQVLRHLSLPNGYVLDYVYWTDANGRPFLYIRKISEKPFATFAEYLTSIGWDAASEQAEKINKNDPNNSEHTRKRISELFKPVEEKREMYLSSVKADGSPEGFYELAVYHILAGQFYLRWHSCYNDTQIAVNKEDIRKIIREVSKKDFGTPLSWSQKQEAGKIDPQPQIKLAKDTAQVSLVVFTKWGGFIKKIFYFQRSYPHLLIKHEDETLVEYDCQILF